jgi:RNA-binding protein Musashi
MFIGGLNWETTEGRSHYAIPPRRRTLTRARKDSLVAYFSQYGTVTSATVMRDVTNGRSRGFAFLAFADSASVNTVLAHQHFLDGKTVRPSSCAAK